MLTTVLVLRMANRKWKETKQEPGTAGPGNMLSCCLNSVPFLWTILRTSTVDLEIWVLSLSNKGVSYE